MTRRFRFTFILVLAALGTGLAALGGWRYARASAPVNGPIILISIDTLRADHLPVYGYRGVKTPVIDQLAADGTVFERAYSHAPLTLPAHVSLLTGRLPFETGVRDDIGFSVKAGERLLPQMLRERGYTTGGVVSAYVLRKETGISQGFDFFDGDSSSSSPEIAGEHVRRDGAESEAVAERWLDAQRSPRVFLFLHLYEPHKPYSPPPQYAEYDAYDGEVAYADEIVGRLIHYLKSHQLYDRSTIVLLSDHGEGLGDHGEQEHGLFLYEEAIRVPLIVKQAGGAGSGRRTGQLVQHIDIVPTMLDFAKAPIPGSLRGRSLKPLLDGTGSLPERVVYSEALYARYHFGWSALTAITAEGHRYLSAPQEELYDLERDPHERRNIADARDDRRQALRRSLDRLTAGTTMHAASETSEAVQERFRALGYVGVEAIWSSDGDAAVDSKEKVPVLEAYRQAGVLMTKGWLGQAVDLLTRTVRDNPMMPDAWQQLAYVLTRAGRLEQAARAYERSATLAPGSARDLVAAATALLTLGHLDDAQRDANMALERISDPRDPSLAMAENTLARISLARKDLDAARAHAANAQRAEPTSPYVACIDGLALYDQGDYDAALARFAEAEAALRDKPARLAELHFYAGETLGRLERWDEAVTEFSQELEVFPRNLRARAALATAYRANGQSEDAERVLDELIKAAPTPEGYGLAARAWTMLGNPRRAEALRAEAHRVFRGDPSLKLLAQK